MFQTVFFLVFAFMFLLQFKELSFLVGARSIAAEGAVGVDDTMAGNDDSNRVVTPS